MQLIDWRGLMRVGLHELRLRPDQFWRLTPAELRIMMGVDTATPPLTRARLSELAAAFPDIAMGTGDGDD
ncbi:MAG: rcc01693 family protein [Paracoccaceae bacterium]